jgi:hypothetical protein
LHAGRFKSMSEASWLTGDPGSKRQELSGRLTSADRLGTSSGASYASDAELLEAAGLPRFLLTPYHAIGHG